MSVRTKAILLIFLLLLIDQLSKFYIKMNFIIGQEAEVLPWFKIYFIENPGMAFGIDIFGKLFLTLFRIVAVVVLSVFIHRMIKKNVRTGLILSVSVLLAGAAGNIIDSVLYGVIFSESTTYQVATLFPPEGGYAALFHGKVVDMFFFPIITNSAGNTVFFKYIFNVADSCVTVSFIIILLFFRKELNDILDSKKTKTKPATDDSEK